MPQANALPTAKTSTPPNTTVTGLAGWVEVFKAGTHTASKGEQCTFSRADLDQMVANHSLGAAPAVIGHPKETDPAYAWVDEYKRDGDSLFAKFTDINPAFEAGVASGAYRNRSVSVFPDKAHGWRVRHVGWLGAAPPAIDGLKAVSFAAEGADAMEFTAPGYSLVWAVESIAKLLRNLRDQLIAKEGIAAADAALPQWQIDSAIESAAQARIQFQEADTDTGGLRYSQHQPTGNLMTTFTQEQLDAAAAAAGKAADDKAAVTFAAQAAELTKLRNERQAERIKTEVDGLTAQGIVTPAEAVGMNEFMAAIENVEVEFSFSASDGKSAKKSPAAFFRDFVASRKAVVKLGKTATSENDNPDMSSDPAAVSVKAMAFMAEQAAKGITVQLPDAVAKFMTKG